MNLNRNIRTTLISLLFVLNFSTVSSQNKLNIIDKTVSFGMRTTSLRDINSIIVHSVYNASGGDIYDIDLIINQFARYHVSSHYVIGRQGTIYQLVSEKNVSFHAGQSSLPDGHQGVNLCSIGIELMDSIGSSPTEEQIRSLTLLVKDIQRRYPIKYVLRHSDIAPGRKTDPWNMDWEDFMSRISDKGPFINFKKDSMFNLKIDTLFRLIH
jgi:N-acetyl-anhydromuramyl-L-alanine amidase AmpD